MEDLERAKADAREERAELARQHDIAMQRVTYVMPFRCDCMRRVYRILLDISSQAAILRLPIC
jgi:hypothetical protein